MNFKILINYLIIAASLGLLSCGKENPPLYDVNIEGDFEIGSGLNTIETHYFIIRNVQTFYKHSAGLHNIDTSKIKNVQASKGLLTGSFQDIDFDFVSRVSVYAVSRKDPTLKREMYYLDFVPLGTNEELRMLSSTTELKEILREEFIDLEIRLNFRNFTGPNLKARIEFGYAVF